MNCPREEQDMDFIIDRSSTALLMIYLLFAYLQDRKTGTILIILKQGYLFVCLLVYLMYVQVFRLDRWTADEKESGGS